MEDGELPDAAETEAQWSTVVTTEVSTRSQIRDPSESATGVDKMQKSSKISRTDSKQRTQGNSVTGQEIRPTRRKRQLAPVDEGKVL